MYFTQKTKGSDSILQALTAQLNNTITLRAQVQRAQMRLRSDDTSAADLLQSLSNELSTIGKLINLRLTDCGRIQTAGTVAELPATSEDETFPALLREFCNYDRNTSDRKLIADQSNDFETAILLDRILTFTNRSLWFLDVYSNAMSIKCQLSRLPKWNSVAAGKQIAKEVS